MKQNPKLEYSKITKFLTSFDPNRKDWFFQAIRPKGSTSSCTGTLEKAEPWLDKFNTTEYGLFYCPAEFKTGNKYPKNENITRINHLYIDLDSDHEKPKEFHVKPTYKVQTSPKGMHAYWKTKEYAPLELFPSLQKDLIDRYKSDPAIHDLRRILRLPYTYNSKYGEPHLVTATFNDVSYPIAKVAMPRGANPSMTIDAVLNITDPSCSYDEWLRTLMALHFEDPSEVGFQKALHWSSQGSNFKDENEIRTKWNSFDSSKNHLVTPQSILGIGKEILFPHTFSNGKPKNTAENLKAITNASNIKVHFNEMKKDLEIVIPDFKAVETIEDQNKIAKIKSLCGEFNLPTSTLVEYLELNSQPYHPAKDWIEGKEWDGVSRISDLVEALGSDDEFAREYVIKWATHAVACLYEKTNSEGMLVIQCKQGMGKGRFFKRLAQEDLIQDSIHLEPNNKDSVHKATSSWLVELGELDGITRKADVAHLKSFVTSSEDRYRLPYAARDNSYARRTAYYCSVNEPEFLMDATGNRRFWILQTKCIDHEHDIDVQQFWAEIKAGYLKGDPWHLSQEAFDYTNINNEKFITTDHFEEKIFKGWEMGTLLKADHNYSSSDIAEELGLENPHQGQLKKIGQAMKKLGCEQVTYSRRKVWRTPKDRNT